MTSIHITDNAKLDLKNIKAFIAQDNPERAVNYLEEVMNKFFTTVESFPMSCQRYRKRKNIRRFVCGNYNIYYSYSKKADHIEVLQVFHSAQMINSIFFD